MYMLGANVRLGYVPQTHFSSQHIHFTRAGLEGVAISDVPEGARPEMLGTVCGRGVPSGEREGALPEMLGAVCGRGCPAVGGMGCRRCGGEGGLPEMLGRWAAGGAPVTVRWGSA